MKTAKALREEIDALRDELTGIVNLATKEDRELTDDEQIRVEAITDEELPKLNASLERQQKLTAEIKAAAAARMNAQIDSQLLEVGGDVSPEDRVSRIVVPAKARSSRQLKAFSGPDAEKEAYLAGNWLIAVMTGNHKASEFCKSHGVPIRNVMWEGENSKGGFLVPEEMDRAIVRLREARGVFPQYARRWPMGSAVTNVPRMLADVTAYWGAENGALTASDAELGNARLVAEKLTALTKFSTEFDEDSVVDVGDMLTASMAYAMADKIDDAGFNGDGTSTYGGVLGLKNALSSSAVINAASGNDSALELDLADFEAVIGAYPEYPGASPRWFVHKAVWGASMQRLADAAGGNTVSDIASGASMTSFMGYPVTFSQVLPSTTGTLASTIVAYFGDLSLGATMGVRRGTTLQLLSELYAENDQLGLKATQRVAITVHETGDTIRTRPILALKTAS